MTIPFGGIDAGGTKWACAIGTSPDDIRDATIIPTTKPEETLSRVADFFIGWMKKGHQLRAIGVSSFGPLIRDLNHPRWGHLHNAPKLGWEHASIGPTLTNRIGVPVGMDTDVNGAALAEHAWGNGAGLTDITYITIGTGIGGAIIANNKLVVGKMHSELGHFRPQRHVSDDFTGMCIYHTDCYEGLASGPAIEMSTGMHPSKLPRDHECWKFVAYYIGQLCNTVFHITSSERIVLGGGVMENIDLIEDIRSCVIAEMGEYLSHPSKENIADSVVRSAWSQSRSDGLNAGVFGGFLIAQAAEAHRNTARYLRYGRH